VQCNEIRREWRLIDIASEATNYIYDIVKHFLAKEPADLDHLGWVGEAFHDPEISSLDLFTLNHDIVIERYLEGCGIEYTDRFGAPDNGVRYWTPKVFEDSSRNMRLLKLHGSVNWFLFQSHGQTWRNARVGIAVDGRPWDTKDRNGQPQRAVGERPMLLVGTLNKMLAYTSGIHALLFFEFSRALRETELLIVSGYSFGDKGINRQLAEWVDSADQKQKVMVVIHSEPKDLKKGAGTDIFMNWDCWLQSKRLVFVQRWIEETSWQDIKAAIQ